MVFPLFHVFVNQQCVVYSFECTYRGCFKYYIQPPQTKKEDQGKRVNTPYTGLIPKVIPVDMVPISSKDDTYAIRGLPWQYLKRNGGKCYICFSFQNTFYSTDGFHNPNPLSAQLGITFLVILSLLWWSLKATGPLFIMLINILVHFLERPLYLNNFEWTFVFS